MKNIDLKIGKKNAYLFFYRIAGDIIISSEENDYYGAVVNYSTIINRGRGIQTICIPKRNLTNSTLKSFTLTLVRGRDEEIFGTINYCPENRGYSLRTTIGWCVASE